MNNNYHTLMNKQNMLNEIAANNHLLQNKVNIQGTPINRVMPFTYPTIQPNPISSNPSNNDTDIGDELELSEQKPEPKLEEKEKSVEKPKPEPKQKNVEKIPRQCPIQPIKIVNVPAKQNTTAEYVIVPILLAILFFVLIYPKTSKMFEKYLPPLTNTKGIAIRAILFAVLYIAIKFSVGLFTKKKN